MIMVTLDKCLEHLKKLEQADTAILGIEGFVLDNGNRTPSMDAIADFSSLYKTEWTVFLRKSHDAAEKFINVMLEDKICDAFEFTVSKRADHARE